MLTSLSKASSEAGPGVGQAWGLARGKGAHRSPARPVREPVLYPQGRVRPTSVACHYGNPAGVGEGA